MLITIEKVIMLQEIDVFEQLTTEDLAQLASIAQEVEFPPDCVIYSEGSPPDSMYLVIEGRVLLHQGQKEVLIAGEKDMFGTWALFEDEPRVVTATALEQSRLLRIDKEDFIDLLADNVRITRGILEALVQRMRRLMGLVKRRDMESEYSAS
ncbi:MAG: cyclic nucleotide-binding domain-containing protein [Candidatus Latescibacteria bacterium]|nr:cyclic nucleotide-binding domain-containing protein [Candidatus Latescibacterota bacterium]MCK5733760.1 cyclic nucleotide-binding domain-containing protein [Candidatus Latescibacterota bacterium]